MSDKTGSGKTGWERENRKHFDEIVEAYDLRRSEYPGELFRDIFQYVGTGADKKAVEIGAGTGKATVPFLNAGYRVTAVEIGENMSEFLNDKFKNCMNFNVVNAAFEEISLVENSYDLIYAASAFHWVDPTVGCPKAYRLLKMGGVLALFRYNVIAAEGEELYEEIQAVYEKHYYDFYTSQKRPVKKSKEDFMTPLELSLGFGVKDMSVHGFSDVAIRFYDDTRTFCAEEYIALLDTMSDHRGLPVGNRVALFEGIKEAIIRHGGQHNIQLVFQLYMGRKRERAEKAPSADCYVEES